MSTPETPRDPALNNVFAFEARPKDEATIKRFADVGFNAGLTIAGRLQYLGSDRMTGGKFLYTPTYRPDGDMLCFRLDYERCQQAASFETIIRASLQMDYAEDGFHIRSHVREIDEAGALQSDLIDEQNVARSAERPHYIETIHTTMLRWARLASADCPEMPNKVDQLTAMLYPGRHQSFAKSQIAQLIPLRRGTRLA